MLTEGIHNVYTMIYITYTTILLALQSGYHKLWGFLCLTKLLEKDTKILYVDGFTVTWFLKMKNQVKNRESCSKLS